MSERLRRRKIAAEYEENVQGEALQARLQRLNLATIVEFCTSVRQLVLQGISDNARVAVVVKVLLKHLKACTTILRSIVGTNTRKVWVQNMCRACMYLSAAQ